MRLRNALDVSAFTPKRLPQARPSRGWLSREEAIAAADLYRTLALGFSYPEPGLVDGVRRGIDAALIAQRAGELPARLAGLLRNAARSWRDASLEGLSSEHSRLFLGSALVPMREGGYGDGLRFAGQPVDLADLNGFYLAFGFGPPPTAASPPDHLGTELEFMSLLNLKTAYAIERRGREQAEITRAAMRRFLEDHLGRWVEAFSVSLRQADAAPAYASLAGLVTRAVESDAHRLGATLTRAGPGTAADPIGLDALTCPLAGEARPDSAASPDAM